MADAGTRGLSLPLSCPVRGCHEPLLRRDRSLACPRAHTYDVARSGYINLLQPQDRKSLDAGDSREAVEARAALIADGVGHAVIDAVVSTVRALATAKEPPVVVDLGSGSGETLGLLAGQRPVAAIGIDLSTAAAAHAARRFPAVTWVVANADRRLPLLDGSVDVLLSVHGRRNPVECCRVLEPGGRLVVAIPAADDLIELRELVQGEAVARNRVAQLVAEHDAGFEVVEQRAARRQHTLEADALRNLLRGTYRGERLSASPRVAALDRLTVTLASDIVVFAPRPS